MIFVPLSLLSQLSERCFVHKFVLRFVGLFVTLVIEIFNGDETHNVFGYPWFPRGLVLVEEVFNGKELLKCWSIVERKLSMAVSRFPGVSTNTKDSLLMIFTKACLAELL